MGRHQIGADHLGKLLLLPQILGLSEILKVLAVSSILSYVVPSSEGLSPAVGALEWGMPPHAPSTLG